MSLSGTYGRSADGRLIPSNASPANPDLVRKVMPLLDEHHIRFGHTSYSLESAPWNRVRKPGDITLHPIPDGAKPSRSIYHRNMTLSSLMNHVDNWNPGREAVPLSFIHAPYISPQDLSMWRLHFSRVDEVIADWYRFGFTPGRAALWRAIGYRSPYNPMYSEVAGEHPMVRFMTLTGARAPGISSEQKDRLETYWALIAVHQEKPISEHQMFDLMLKWYGVTGEDILIEYVYGMTADYISSVQTGSKMKPDEILEAFKSGYPAEWASQIITARRGR